MPTYQADEEEKEGPHGQEEHEERSYTLDDHVEIEE
jgi:hypothetical protein